MTDQNCWTFSYLVDIIFLSFEDILLLLFVISISAAFTQRDF